MARDIWNPPKWLAWYGYATALTWGVAIPVPTYAKSNETGKGRHRAPDLDQELIQLLAEERG